MSFGALKTKGPSKGLHRFVKWCVDRFIDFINDDSRAEIRSLLAAWDITVRVVPRKSQLWDQFAHRDKGSIVRGVTVLSPPQNWRYKQRSIPVMLEPQLLLYPPMLGVVLMHELGHALRYAELQRVAKQAGWREGMYLNHEAGEEDADATAAMFVQGVVEMAQKHGEDPEELVRRVFCEFAAKDPVLAAMIARVAKDYGEHRPCP